MVESHLAEKAEEGVAVHEDTRLEPIRNDAGNCRLPGARRSSDDDER